MARSVSPSPGTPQRDLPEILDPLRADLDLVGERYRAILSGTSWRIQDMVTQAARFQGKRLRPALTCLAARVAGRPVSQDVATVAAIVEIIHTATLVHDDILDGAEVRRKVATLNARWGDQVAVLVGDVLFNKAYLAAARLPDRFASRYLSEVMEEVLEGEIHQDLVARHADLSEPEYREIIRGKTAALYEASLVVGAHYAGAGRELSDALGRYGHHLGMAFQIVDDRLDLTGDEATVGKTLGRDLLEGKTTLPVIYWLGSRPDSERGAARALVEAAWEDPRAGLRLAQRLADDGSLARADAAARVEIEAAAASLAGVPRSPGRELLEAIARYILVRPF
jgi:octaprenyl-diphosphate synthase